MADNLIAAMKKLSLNKFQRLDMLEKGLLQWLIQHMETVEFTASMFHMECIIDLLRILMNVENATELAGVNVSHLIIVLGEIFEFGLGIVECDFFFVLLQSDI